MKTVAIVQARMSSSRLPGKSLMDLGGMKVLDWVVRAAQNATGVDKVVVATSTDTSDDALVAHCEKSGVPSYRGDLNDVLARFYNAAREYKADTVVRLTADCPFLDSNVISTLLQLYNRSDVDFASTALVTGWPDGLDCEVMSFDALEKSFKNSNLPSHREHVTQYISQNRSLFQTINYNCPVPGLQDERWTLDHPQDFEVLSEVAKHLPKNRGPYFHEVLKILDANPALRKLNSSIPLNEGLAKSKVQDRKNESERSFHRSQEMLARAEKSIPLGSQTFSKSRTQYPVGFAPLYVTHGYGARTWDVDGNEYVDLVNALLPNVLGYADPDVNFAIRNQLNSGITFSLATELEIELAEKLIEIIPCAELVRFGKNGSDATSACIRVARAFTGRERVMACGYHGWQDWYIGSTTMNRGVPKAVQDLTHSVAYNDLQAVEDMLKKHPGEFACLIMEPMNFVEPHPGYHAALKSLLEKHGVLLVFDEIITGFRYSLGGAQEYFGVTPHLAAFGKSLGNGMPIAAIVGRRDIMKTVEQVFYSGTFGGETPSIVASLAVIKKMQEKKVIPHLWKVGAEIKTSVRNLIQKLELQSVLDFKGKDPWSLLAVQAYQDTAPEVIKTFLLTELVQNGVLTLGTHNMCYAHGPNEVSAVVNAYSIVLEKLKSELSKGKMADRLKPPVVKPLFKVR